MPFMRREGLNAFIRTHDVAVLSEPLHDVFSIIRYDRERASRWGREEKKVETELPLLENKCKLQIKKKSGFEEEETGDSRWRRPDPTSHAYA
jgi:hypothetical protein